MTRVIAYIDGFNLYFGLRNKGWRRYYWLNLVAAAEAMLKPGQRLLQTHYFTARIRLKGNNHQSLQRQNTYLDALATLPSLAIHHGHYLAKPRQCRNCGSQWTDYEEKMTDVNIAVQMLADAFDDNFDTALLVSGDSDLTTPIKAVRRRFPDKRVIVAFPPKRHSVELIKAANGHFQIGENKFRQNQLPTSITTSGGHTLKRPPGWS